MKTHRSFIDAQRVRGHPGEELPIVAPPEHRQRYGRVRTNTRGPQSKRRNFREFMKLKVKIFHEGTDLKMGQWAELSEWKPLFFCPVRMSQMMMAWGSSFLSISGLKVTTYLSDNTTQRHMRLRQRLAWCFSEESEDSQHKLDVRYLSHGEKSMCVTPRWLNLWICLNFSPPHNAIPRWWNVAR